MERIYIGGLDPPRLTAEEVVSRLEGIDGVNIRSKDLVGNDKKFFYVNAVSNDDKSALDKIAKQYNNVTWKRCKLVVQAARPHFLERLAQERLERQHENEIQKEESRNPHPIPRHLRIRQRFGEEAYQVDTKPCRTTEWSEFCRVVSKLRTRRKEHSETVSQSKQSHDDKAVLARKKMFRNRAVHLRWSEGVNGNRNIEPVLDYGASGASAHDESEDTSSSSEEDDSYDLSVSTTVEKEKRAMYVWSSSETDESSEVDEGNDGTIEPDFHGNSDNEQMAILSEENISSGSESQEGLNEMIAQEHAEDVVSSRQSLTRHDWSNDDTGSDKEEGKEEAATRTILFREPQEAMEFSAAFDFSKDKATGGDSADINDHESNEQIGVQLNFQDLANDVKANLDILSSIFPEMSETTPVALDKSSGHESRRAGTVQPDWESGGLMQRFDPTKESAKKYILENLDLYTNEESPGEVMSDHLSDSNHGPQDDKSDEKTQSPSRESEPTANAIDSKDGTMTDVYEQSKLEGIFRDARSMEVPESPKVDYCKPFAFGFDVGDDATSSKQPVQSSGTFAFAFDLGTEKDEGSGRVDKSETIYDKPFQDEERIDLEGSNEKTNEVYRNSIGIQRRGLFFPDYVLDNYTTAFFEMNEGDRILQDPQGFVRDENVKQQWKRDRNALTLDWKRKRKYAQSRMQKKMKFR